MELVVYKVRDPQGKMREIRGPAGASDADVIAQAQKLFAAPSGPSAAEQVAGDAITRGAKDVTADMGGVDRFLAGAGKAISDAGLGVKQLASYVVPGMDSDGVTAEVVDRRKRDRALMDTGAGMAGNVAGNSGMALAPGGALKGAAVAARAVPALAGAAPAISAAGGAMLAPTSIPGALAVGGGLGIAQPAASSAERVVNALVGAGATAAVPAAIRTFRAGKAAIEPFYEAGQDQIIGRALRSAAGQQADDVARALQGAKELVPGSAPTAGQVAQNPGIAALERAARATNPNVMNAYGAREAAQNQARVALLERLSGSGGRLTGAITKRATQADELYGAAVKKGIDIGRDAASGRFLPKATISGVRGEISHLLKRPAIRDAIEDARKLAANEGVRMSDMGGSVKGLDYVKRALDDKISRATGNEQRVLVALKDRLLTTIDRLSPSYATARETFAARSGPINQMKVVEALMSRSVRPLDGQINPAQFARNLSDRTAQTATGFRKATLENTMSPRQLAQLNALKDDLGRTVFAQNAGRGVGSDTVQKLAMTNILDQAGVPTFFRDVAPIQAAGRMIGRGAEAAYGGANREISERLAMSLLDPQEAARMMSAASPSARAQIAEMLATRLLTPVGMASPAMLNASQ